MQDVLKKLLIFECGNILKNLEAASTIVSRYDAQQGTSTYCREAMDVNLLLSEN
jgi:hypothetical protein